MRNGFSECCVTNRCCTKSVTLPSLSTRAILSTIIVLKQLDYGTIEIYGI